MKPLNGVFQSRLGFGVVVGPFYLTVGLIQAFVRDGFQFSRHALSHLANGSGGWVQTANFVLSGAMVIAASVGIARVLRPHSRATSWFLAAFGMSMLIAAAFPPDPVYGFPPGTPETDPTTVSTSGLIHFAAGALGFTAFGISALLAARALARRNDSFYSRVSLLSGLAVLIGFFGGGAFSSNSSGIAGIWFSVVVGWAWLAALSLHLHRVSTAKSS